MDLMTVDEVSAAYRLPANTLRSWRSRGRGEGPPSFRLGKRVLYRRDQVDAWVEQKMRETSSTPQAV